MCCVCWHCCTTPSSHSGPNCRCKHTKQPGELRWVLLLLICCCSTVGLSSMQRCCFVTRRCCCWFLFSCFVASPDPDGGAAAKPAVLERTLTCSFHTHNAAAVAVAVQLQALPQTLMGLRPLNLASTATGARSWPKTAHGRGSSTTITGITGTGTGSTAASGRGEGLWLQDCAARLCLGA